MPRSPVRIAVVASVALAITASFADDGRPEAAALRPAAPHPVRKDFVNGYLAPNLSAGLAPDRQAALDFGSRVSNPWMRDPLTAERMEHNAVRAAGNALRNWALDRINAQAFAVSLTGNGSLDISGRERAHLRFGISQLAPRAEVVVPLTRGHFGFSADTRGRLGTSFETIGGGLSFGATLDPLSRDATVGLTKRF